MVYGVVQQVYSVVTPDSMMNVSCLHKVASILLMYEIMSYMVSFFPSRCIHKIICISPQALGQPRKFWSHISKYLI